MRDLNAEMERAEQLNQRRQQPSNRTVEKYNEGLEKSKNVQRPSSVSGAMNTARNLSKAATPMGAFAALKNVNLLKDMPFVCAFGFALLKDLLDFLFNPTVVLGIVFSILCSIFIFMMLMLAGSSGKRKAASGFIKKTMVIIGGGIFDSLPGVGFLPAETFTVFVLYVMALSERGNENK